jgi:hypothetical protein
MMNSMKMVLNLVNACLKYVFQEKENNVPFSNTLIRFFPKSLCNFSISHCTLFARWERVGVDDSKEDYARKMEWDPKDGFPMFVQSRKP